MECSTKSTAYYTFIPSLNMHLKNLASFPEAVVFSDLGYWLFTKSSTKPSVSSTTKTSPNLSSYFLIVILLQIFPFFYWYFHGNCPLEITNIIPDPVRRVQTIRSSTHSHPFQVSLPNPRTLSHKSSFIPRTCKLWNVLPSSTFPESYNMSVVKSNTNKLSLSLSFLGFCYRLQGFSPTLLTKNISVQWILYQ